ncbi:SDR family NAD(P)-dependent oxidoreductase [Tenacibaculum finnmarkense]|uniref:SDR family NAD(P)-dependent oxidoreductase n=1 Tax=Tenacibaculum finnmarkense TaxID=2781243 RepID=UPI001EFBCE0D|nr:SDR family NAD(P)-dependent oxidoreductase [Tenacibaculum finnmarkense]MCG8186311.1 SDR family NAD(P)-dependent oxidoreductase [Tenacibaculum finnmarkense genomovar finnmarkense]MCG8793389.1 SDR family NAD(P)-dependent oxidoreductase [Tenacibaculum finnmarkense]MCG8893169.1 SDR family NAD(P)-dependent oxidoreductase [Tenacibaculum finnmarkense]MCG8900976.1 SDR family NAD(P)-dependent oxidoreductase [Tenacibaculum finnmarkense]MCM8862647.1 SDR family NAD(P)-dependent oxidoreductase [Tenaciba
MNIIIITGGSKGIGKALAQKYASENYSVFSLARTLSEVKNVQHISVDLADSIATQTIFTALLDKIIHQKSTSKITSITLINNAGHLGKIANLENLEANDISKSIQLNISTPLILSGLFIKKIQKLSCKKQIINISSGAAKKTYEGWSVYCTSKAAIDMLTKTIASEQSEIENGVKCIAIYPGVVATDMQIQIRNTHETDFKNVQRFIDLKNQNKLYTPSFVADTIYKIDTQNQLNSGDIFDIRNI